MDNQKKELAINYEKIKELPIYSHLDDICETLKNSKSRFLVLNAETAAGKSTGIPLALLKNFSQSIYMIEPRRIAAINIAHRVSTLLDEPCGKTCGYQVHLDSMISKETRFTVMTEALFIRKLQNNPELEGVSVVVLDEFHERSLYTDLSLAFLREVMELRDDLYVIIMSATINSKKLIAYLSDNAEEYPNSVSMGTDLRVTDCKSAVPFYFVEGKNYPVEIEYHPKETVEKIILNLISENDGYSSGDILVFLPGIKEIRRVQNNLEEYNLNEEILVLHSSVPFDEQKKVFNKGTDSKRRIILSSAIAETSVTIPGITVVVDTGLARYNMYNQNNGMEYLVTRNESEFNAEQRTGRAGRLQKGKCIRLWSSSEKLLKENVPEILRSDLSSVLLECAEWGVSDLKSLRWLDLPSESSCQAAEELLNLLGCIDKEKKITETGKAVLSCGVNIRTACIALSGIPYEKMELSTIFANDIECELTGTDYDKRKSLQNLLFRVQKAQKIHKFSKQFNLNSTEFSTYYALLAGFPDRLGKRIVYKKEANKEEVYYQFYSGKLARMGTDKITNSEYIVAINVNAGTDIGMIYSFREIEKSIAEKYIQSKSGEKTDILFDKNKKSITKIKHLVFGKIILNETKLPVEEKDYLEAWKNLVKEEGLSALPLSEKSKSFINRIHFYLNSKVDDNLKEKFESSKNNIEDWIIPFCPADKNNKIQITEKNVYDALYWYFDGNRIDKEVPETIILPNKFKLKILYEKQNNQIIPAAEVIIQKIFGCFETPEVLGCPVVLKLLSPARRPLQITSDLSNFWKTTWPEICSEMKGRYPKHNWDYRIAEEED